MVAMIFDYNSVNYSKKEIESEEENYKPRPKSASNPTEGSIEVNLSEFDEFDEKYNYENEEYDSNLTPDNTQLTPEEIESLKKKLDDIPSDIERMEEIKKYFEELLNEENNGLNYYQILAEYQDELLPILTIFFNNSGYNGENLDSIGGYSFAEFITLPIELQKEILYQESLTYNYNIYEQIIQYISIQHPEYELEDEEIAKLLNVTKDEFSSMDLKSQEELMAEVKEKIYDQIKMEYPNNFDYKTSEDIEYMVNHAISIMEEKSEIFYERYLIDSGYENITLYFSTMYEAMIASERLDYQITQMEGELLVIPYLLEMSTEEYQNWINNHEGSIPYDLIQSGESSYSIYYKTIQEGETLLSPIDAYNYLKEKYPGVIFHLPKDVDKLIELNEINPELLNYYNYLFYTSLEEGKSVEESIAICDKFLEDSKNELNKLIGMKNAQEFFERLSTSTPDEIEVMMEGFITGIEEYIEGINLLIHNEDTITALEYEIMYITLGLKTKDEKITEGVLDSEGNSNILLIPSITENYPAYMDYIYTLLRKVGQATPSILLNNTDLEIGTILNVLSNTGTIRHETYMNGLSEIESFMYCIFMAAEDHVIGKVLDKIAPIISPASKLLVDKLKYGIKKMSKEEVKGIINQLVSEGEITEEDLTEIMIDGILA